MTPYYQDDSTTIYCEKAEEVLARLPDSSIDLIVTDPPYFKVKNEFWDRQWQTPSAFVEWVGAICEQFHRVLKPNGSLYFFASPRMAARVEVKIGERFNVLNHITWAKPSRVYIPPYCGNDKQRSYTPLSERIIFAEHYGADNIAKGEAGYEAKCDELRGFVFEPLRKYLDDERIAAGFTPEDCNDACGHRREGGMAGRHYFSASQWCLPTAENYEKLRITFNAKGGEFLRREYEDLRREYEDLRREYEDLRREYEDLRRPFSVTADVPYTDVWDFPTVSYYKGKHVCEKPYAMIEHILKASGKPDAVVLDAFAGSFVTIRAARDLGMQSIGVDFSEAHCKSAVERLQAAQQVSLLHV